MRNIVLNRNEQFALAVAFGLLIAAVVLIYIALGMAIAIPELPPLQIDNGRIPA